MVIYYVSRNSASKSCNAFQDKMVSDLYYLVNKYTFYYPYSNCRGFSDGTILLGPVDMLESIPTALFLASSVLRHIDCSVTPRNIDQAARSRIRMAVDDRGITPVFHEKFCEAFSSANLKS